MLQGGAWGLGRYEIVGRIGAGGMAEVLLGRLRGPHGFERPVVIKRILPHLVPDRGIVDLFLDEARIIAKLRHPNLIHVHELGLDGTDLFIVMEYLEAESGASLSRRLASRGMQLDYAIAAHIVADACAGLHAAHEASADGRPLAIVHRDVSPQNILVSYGGTVHIIDFGIAVAADRISRTEAGTIRGKFEYMAPEQLRAAPIDRRADVFALGVVLFELATGRRLYKRESHAAAVSAVLNEPVPLMASFRADVPAQLQTICARALAKNRDERYASAAEMRRALLAFVHTRTDADLADILSRLMRDIFADRIAEKAEMLGRVRRGDSLATMPEVEVDLYVELPTVAERGLMAHVSPSDPPKVSRPRWFLPTTIAALALLATGLGFRGAWRQTTQSAPPPDLPATAPVAAAAASAAAPSPATPVVHLHIESSPSVATVFAQGRARGTTPLDLAVDESAEPLEIVLSADGFEPARRSVVPNADQLVSAKLLPTRPPPAVRTSVHRSSAAPSSSAPTYKAPTLW